jgi:hypothetical protein
MISPGMIRAGALVSKGVSSKEAMAQGISLDVTNATRRAFFESINKTPSTVSGVNAAESPSISTPQLDSSGQGTSIESSVPWLKTEPQRAFADVTKSNMLDFKQSAVNQIHPSRPRIINTILTDTSNLNYVPDVYSKNPVNAMTSALDKLDTDYVKLTPEFTQNHTKRLASYNQLVNNFLGKQKDLGSFTESFKALENELNAISKKREERFRDAPTKLNVDFSDEGVKKSNTEFVSNYAASVPLVGAIYDIYKKRSEAILANQVIDIINQKFQKAKQANPNLTSEKFFETQNQQYGLDKNAFGIGQLLVENGTFGDYQDYIKFINPGKYTDKFNKPNSGFDANGGLDQYANGQDANDFGLQYSRVVGGVRGGQINQGKDRVSGDYRLQPMKDDVIFSGLNFAKTVGNELAQRSINDIRKREKLVVDYNKKQKEDKFTKDDQLKFEDEISKINNSLSYSSDFEKSVPKIYDIDKLEKNSLIQGFAQDRFTFIKEQQKDQFDYNHGSKVDKFLLGSKRNAGAFVKTILNFPLQGAKFLEQTVLNGMLGVPKSADYKSRDQYYNWMQTNLEIPVLIDEIASKEAGRTVTTDDAFYSNPNSFLGFNVHWSGFMQTAATVIPQSYGMLMAGRGVQSLLGSALEKGLKSGTMAGILDAAGQERFAATLAKTGNPASAWGATFRGSNNYILRELVADRLPNAVGMYGMMYPEQYHTTLSRLRLMGVKDAEDIARNVASIGTGIEVLSENIIPNIKYLDDFAEKGIGLKNLFNRTTKGSFEQYSNLYSGVLGGKLSEKTIGFLARNSADIAGKLGAAGRLYASRSSEEGLEEVFSELANVALDNFTNYAAYRHEKAHEFSIAGVRDAFLGGFAAPSAGTLTQVKAYSENKKYGAMYDMMLNADYYSNKINKAVQKNELSRDEAAKMLSNLQQLTQLADEYNVKNLKKKIDGVQLTSDLVSSPEKQFDFFKHVLKVKGIEDRKSVV